MFAASVKTTKEAIKHPSKYSKECPSVTPKFFKNVNFSWSPRHAGRVTAQEDIDLSDYDALMALHMRDNGVAEQ